MVQEKLYWSKLLWSVKSKMGHIDRCKKCRYMWSPLITLVNKLRHLGGPWNGGSISWESCSFLPYKATISTWCGEGLKLVDFCYILLQSNFLNTTLVYKAPAILRHVFACLNFLVQDSLFYTSTTLDNTTFRISVLSFSRGN